MSTSRYRWTGHRHPRHSGHPDPVPEGQDRGLRPRYGRRRRRGHLRDDSARAQLRDSPILIVAGNRIM
jgi:hypothetical protein